MKESRTFWTFKGTFSQDIDYKLGFLYYLQDISVVLKIFLLQISWKPLMFLSLILIDLNKGLRKPLMVVNELPKASSTHTNTLPKAVGVGTFLQISSKRSIGFREPFNMGSSSFRKFFCDSTSVFLL